MFAYRHTFHAGNHADVLKHAVLLACLRYLNDKDKPYWVIDTHAGAGAYTLKYPRPSARDDAHIQRKAEFEDGIARLWNAPKLPLLLASYVQAVRDFNAGGELAAYPGSPMLARTLLRPDDKLRLFELHPTDFDLLERQFERDRAVKVERSDGFAALKSLLPPATRRALILIDPSYEIKTDYAKVLTALREGLERFATGMFVLWYPLVARNEATQMHERLLRLQGKWLDVNINVCPPADDGLGMTGSGMFIINPPWVLAQQLRESLPVLIGLLAQYPQAHYNLTESRDH
jgi:23S rRNA (adenine2030-N6)-methyltransferase